MSKQARTGGTRGVSRWGVLFAAAALVLASGCSEDDGGAGVEPDAAGSSDADADVASSDEDASDGDTSTDDTASTDDATAPDGDTSTEETASTDDGTSTGDTTSPAGPVQVTPPDNWNSDLHRTPRSVHMTWQRDPATTMSFSWTTQTIDLEAYTPRVWVVPSSEVTEDGMPWSEQWVVEGTGQTYRESLLGTEVGDETYVAWEAEITGLEPQTQYTYRVGTWEGFDPATGTFTAPDLSEPATFTTGIPKGEREPFHFMMAGDSRLGEEQIAANIDRLADMDADVWFFNGDMTQGGTQPEWSEWFAAMQPLLDRRPLMPVQGNHEIFANVYYAQYALPREPDLPEHLVEHAWSLDYANIHFVGLDSNAPDNVKDQVEWLDADLAAASEDEDIDWIIVMFHHAVYSASNHGSTARLQEHWKPVFEKHGVDLVFTGHDHNYERTHPIRDDAVAEDGDGVVYVVAGAFYAPGYSNGHEWWTVTSTHGDEGNYVHMHVDGTSITATAWSGDGSEVLDEFTLTKE